MKETAIIQPGTIPAPRKYRIVIDPSGPYLVYGAPPMSQQFIRPNTLGEIWYYQQGREFDTDMEPMALCRCGCSKNAPYCDGSHIGADWNPELTASEEPILSNAERIEGQEMTITDNEDYCAYARFCDAKGQIWNLVDKSDNEHARQWIIREAAHCPGARLSAWDNRSGLPIEPTFAPSLVLIEDPEINSSGPLWVRGGIAIQRPDGFTYEIRNRVTLCRCGASSNKPYCDGTHASIEYNDNISVEISDGDRY